MLPELNIFIAGAGSIGTSVAEFILKGHNDFRLKLIGVSNSKTSCFNSDGLKSNWKKLLTNSEQPFPATFEKILQSNLSNIIFVDTSSGNGTSEYYHSLATAGISIVSANKVFNTGNYRDYCNLRSELKKQSATFLYETNVGAALPVINAVKSAVKSGEQIYSIRGVFSGSLNYIFHRFSGSKDKFSSIVEDASLKGFTETDSSDDLSGLDVGRKLLILAREAGMHCNLEDVKIESLIPDNVQPPITGGGNKEQQVALNRKFDKIRDELSKGYVLKYIGELTDRGSMKTSLEMIPANSPIGSLEDTDNIFEIYSDTYRESPLIIRGPGAGTEVTARGVFTDIIRAGEVNCQHQEV